MSDIYHAKLIYNYCKKYGWRKHKSRLENRNKLKIEIKQEIISFKKY